MYSVELSKEQIIQISQEEGPEINEANPLNEAALPDRVRAMTRDTCVDFVKAMTTLPNILRQDYRVKQFF
jgi:hypothetical protein